MSLYYADEAVTLYLGDALDVLRSLPDGSVDCCVTSPPYFGLRDYGMADQIGLEKTPDEFVTELVNVFREVRRVLRDDGTLWLNIGDIYNAAGRSGHGTRLGVKTRDQQGERERHRPRTAGCGWTEAEGLGRHSVACGICAAGGWVVPASRYYLAQTKPHAGERNGPLHEGA